MDIDEIFRKGKSKKLQLMLRSVYLFNSNLEINDKQERLLKKVIEAMTVMDRKYFVDSPQAYADTALPIGELQTISQPSTVARMIVLSGLKEGNEVLEIGTGGGWNAALIAYLINPGKLVTIERISKLAEKAEKNIKAIKRHLPRDKKECLKNIDIINENIFDKNFDKKFDRVIFTAGIEKGKEEVIENMAKRLLKDKGRLVCPYGSGPLLIYDKEKGELSNKKTKEMYNFVSLIN